MRFSPRVQEALAPPACNPRVQRPLDAVEAPTLSTKSHVLRGFYGFLFLPAVSH